MSLLADEDKAELKEAKTFWENRDVAVKITSYIRSPIEKG